MGGCHFCGDELAMILMAPLAVRFGWTWIQKLWNKRHQKPLCGHDHDHKE